MNEDSKDFLLKEYEQIFTFMRHLFTAQDRAVALYLALVAAIATWTIQLATEEGKLAAVLDLPTAFWSLAWALFVLVSATLQVLMTRWWTLAVEYTSTLNAIRAKFAADDPSIVPFLRLPRTPRWAMPLSLSPRSAQSTLFFWCRAWPV